ncbi:hypothetical protein R1sor_013054 [Riccia sorocarpa]|uniref:Phytocyanin domain-containing protein n=1 Tax=Riccia sorocarpa TaxID=122646 RepID=A0ABD3H5E8_9MARC
MAGPGCRIFVWAAALLFLCSAAAPVRAQIEYGKTVKVGDEIGWTYINATSGKPADYQSWSKRYTFFVNDILEFSYTPGKQNLYSFDNFEGWTACNLSDALLLDNGTTGFSQWYLPYEGYYDFASGIYCEKGQKFRIYAVNASSIPFASAPTPATAQSPAPGPDIAPSSELAPAPTSGGDFPPSLGRPPDSSPPAGARVPDAAPPSSSASRISTPTICLLASLAASAVAMVL